jgi:hypothetical protein
MSFTQIGDEFVWTAPVQDINAVPTTTAVTVPLGDSPQGVSMVTHLRGFFQNINGNSGVDVYSPLETSHGSVTPAVGTTVRLVNGDSEIAGAFTIDVLTDTSAQIVSASDTSCSSNILHISVYGWRDNRGKN